MDKKIIFSLLVLMLLIVGCSGKQDVEKTDEKTEEASQETPLQETSQYGSLTIKSDPAGAEVYVDDAIRGKTPVAVTGLDAGKHKVAFKKYGYEDLVEAVDISAGEIREYEVKLMSLGILEGAINVKTDPGGATIYVNGAYKGNSPMVVSGIDVGEQQLLFVKDDYKNYSTAVTVILDKVVDVDVKLEPTGSLKGKVLAQSDPAGADFYLDGTYKGKTPLSVSKVDSGEHKVSFKLEGWDDFVGTVEVSAGETANVKGVLEKPKPNMSAGSLKVTSTPEGAEFYLGEELKGETPLTIENVLVGDHEFKFVKSGYATYTGTIYIAPAKIGEVNGVLTAIKQNYAALLVDSEPQGAKVYLDEGYKGKTPLTIKSVSVGNHKLQVDMEGFRSFKELVDIVPGETNEVLAVLEEK